MKTLTAQDNFRNGFNTAIEMWVAQGFTFELIDADSRTPGRQVDHAQGMRAAVEALRGWYDTAERMARTCGISRPLATRLVDRVREMAK